MKIKRPVAVLISDVHYNIYTLELADKSMRMAIDRANCLAIPLIVAGDLHDTKASMRGECVNAMLDTFKLVKTECFIMCGNHDLLNEKSSENSLEFLEGLHNKVWLIRKHMRPVRTGVECIAYHSNPDELRAYLKTLPKNSVVVMHQGLEGSDSGEYIQDKSAIKHKDVKNFTVISGHYHRRQTINTGAGKTFSYVGNPYTLNFSEAEHPEKGFQILYEDGSLEFVSTNLRKHVVLEYTTGWPRIAHGIYTPISNVNTDDIVKIKVRCSKSELRYITKNTFSCSVDFKLELCPYDEEILVPKIIKNECLLDQLIDSHGTYIEQKERLKDLWKTICSE